MRNKKGDLTHLIAPAVIVLIIVFVFLVLVVGQPRSESFNLVPGMKGAAYENTVFSASPGHLGGDVEGEKTKSKTFSFGGIKLDKSVKTSKELLSNSVTVSRSFFVDDPQTLSFEGKKGAKLAFSIASKQGGGILTLVLNGNTVFSEQAYDGQIVKIGLPGIVEGSNKLAISVSSAGIFSKNSYTLSDIELIVPVVGDSSAIARTFDLNNTVFSGASKARFTSSVVKLPKKAAGELIIDVNGNNLYSKTPDLTDTIELLISPGYLAEGLNTLTFSTEEGAGYQLLVPSLVVAYKPGSGKSRSYEFQMSDEDTARVKKVQYTKCTLSVEKASGSDMITLNLNGRTYRPNLISSKTWSIDVCRYLVADTNTLTVTADNEVSLASISILVTNKG